MDQSYVNWTKRYIFFHSIRHPDEKSADEIEAFLTNLAVNENVTTSNATHLLETHFGLCTIQELLDHKDVMVT